MCCNKKTRRVIKDYLINVPGFIGASYDSIFCHYESISLSVLNYDVERWMCADRIIKAMLCHVFACCYEVI